MEFGPAHGRSESEAKKHRIQENKAGNSRIRVLKQYHESDQPNSRAAEVQFAGGIVGQRHTDDSECGIESAHEGKVDIFGVFFAGLEFKGSIVAGQVT